jgi:hypothetical protein
MSASIKFNESSFKTRNKTEFRAQPEKEFEHRLNTRHHLAYVQDEKLFDVRDPRWAKHTIDGEVAYAHRYEGGIVLVRLKTADGRLNLSHNEDGTLDRHLMDDDRGQDTVLTITSKNNGMESHIIFKTETIAYSSVGIICAALGMTVFLASGLIAAEAAAAAGVVVATTLGINASVAVPAVGIALAVLALIGMWIAFEIGREIVVNLIYENRSANTPLTLVDTYVYDIPIPDDMPSLPIKFKQLWTDSDGFDWYDAVVIDADNESKYKGVGVSMKFQKADGTSLVICIRQDIHANPNYTIKAFPAGDTTSAHQVYNECTSGGLVTQDTPWGNLIVKNTLKPDQFNNYKFAGILSFNDAA